MTIFHGNSLDSGSFANCDSVIIIFCAACSGVSAISGVVDGSTFCSADSHALSRSESATCRAESRCCKLCSVLGDSESIRFSIKSERTFSIFGNRCHVIIILGILITRL